MIKLSVLILIILSSALTLSGCDSVEELRQSEIIGRQAIEIADEYLDSQVSARSAYNRINSLDDIHVINNHDEMIRLNVSSVRGNLFLLRNDELNENEVNLDTLDRVLSARNSLARRLGLQER